MFILKAGEKDVVGRFGGQRLATLESCRNSYESASNAFSFVLGYATKMKSGTTDTLFISYGGLLDFGIQKEVGEALSRMVAKYNARKGTDDEIMHSPDGTEVTIEYDEVKQSFVIHRSLIAKGSWLDRVLSLVS